MKKKNTYNNITAMNPLLKVFNYILLIFLAVVVLFPILIVFIASFKSNEEYMYSGLLQMPKSFLYLKNYIIVIEKGKMLTGFKNTTILILSSVTLTVILGTMVSFALGRFEFKLKKLIMSLFLAAAIIPAVTVQASIFLVIKNLHLYNTIFAGILIYSGTNIMQILIFLQFIEKIPMALDESVRIDGGSYFRIYTSIILPQLKPAIVTVIILKTIFIYNDMLTPYLYMPKSTLRTVTTSLLSFSSDQVSQWNVMGAGIIFVMVPTIIMVLFLQKYIMSGLTDGAVKG